MNLLKDIKNSVKLFKKIFTIILFATFVFMPTFAIAEDNNYNAKLLASKEESKYEIVIPSDINANECKSFDILAKADFLLYEDNPVDNFVITCDETVTLIKAGNDSISFDLAIANTFKDSYTNTDINPMNADEFTVLGNVSYNLPIINYAGTYKGTLTFTYGMKKTNAGFSNSLLTKNNINNSLLPNDFEINSTDVTNETINIDNVDLCLNEIDNENTDCKEIDIDDENPNDEFADELD